MSRPLYKAGDQQDDKLIRLTPYGRENDKSITMLSSTTDAGNSGLATTILRKGLVVGKLSGGKYDAATDGSVVESTGANVPGTGAQQWDFSGTVALTLTVDGEEFSLVVTDALLTESTTCTVASIVLVLNALAESANCNVSFAALLTSLVQVTHQIPGQDHWFQITGGTLNSTGLSLALSAVFGTDGIYGILTDAVDMKHPNLDAVVDQFANIGTTGVWDLSELLSMTGDAKAMLLRNGAIFR